MESYHHKNLKKYCRTCSKNLNEQDLKRSKKKSLIKLKPSIKSFLFGCDKENIEPEVVCKPCTRIFDKTNRAYVTDKKNKKQINLMRKMSKRKWQTLRKNIQSSV